MISLYEAGGSRRHRRTSLVIAGSLMVIFLTAIAWKGQFTALSKYRGSILDDAANSTLGFQKIFVVNLPHRTDHRDAVSLAAGLTGLNIEYVQGVTEVDRRFLPPGGVDRNLLPGALGCWRAHINILRNMIEQNISSALILEDDADWDLRIKSQMRQFAEASQMLFQPVIGTANQLLDPSFPTPKHGQKPQSFTIGQHLITPAKSSPYGDLDRWDFLWVGHCGTRFAHASDETVPLGRVVIPNDPSVAESQHLNMQFGNSEIFDEYPPHTRVVSHAKDAVCTVGYAISQRGARKMLHEAGLVRMDDPIDIVFQYVCDGNGRPRANCLTVQPQLFQTHRPIGRESSFSDISDRGDAFNEKAFTRNIRWSTRLNYQQLLDGTEDYVDLFKDGEVADERISSG